MKNNNIQRAKSIIDEVVAEFRRAIDSALPDNSEVTRIHDRLKAASELLDVSVTDLAAAKGDEE